MPEILSEKWKKFLKYRFFFSLIPFVDFVLVAGSLATGKANEESDFDVIIGAKAGRIFTVRIFTMGLFGILGVRRKRLGSKENMKDKICLYHFVTPKSYKLPAPYNDGWRELYPKLVPVFGLEKSINYFFNENFDWAGERKSNNNLLLKRKFNLIRDFLEFFLDGFLGNFTESLFKRIQLGRIQKNENIVSKGAGPRFRCNDDELAFHHYLE